MEGKRLPHKTAPCLISQYLTDFIWLTADELIAIVEQVNDNLEGNAIKVALLKMHGRGLIERRLVLGAGMQRGRLSFQYKALNRS
jgi:hypothetical protein